ncbi:Dabb family protein [Myroides injenensis]|uniref:Dabb family protein n=1 Tax=Myroides injenensis TaxID=1183151 RepID=UPI000289813B|nr:Dabb family protein [Myroides injenensis]
MIRHIVMWRLKDENKEANKIEIKKRLLSLEGKIAELKSIAVEFNLPEISETNYDVILLTEFNNSQDLDIYANHPLHLEVVSFIKSVVSDRVAIDY